MVELPDKQLTPFNRDYLFASIHESCRHRPASVDDAAALTQTVISELVRLQRNGLLSRHQVATTAHTVLSRFDTTAAAVYAALHHTPATS